MQLPAAVVAKVYGSCLQAGVQALTLQLRSNFFKTALPVRLHIATVYVLSDRAASATAFMAALAGQGPGRASGMAVAEGPGAELLLDGVRYTNLLASPVVTPQQAARSLLHAMLASRRSGIVRLPARRPSLALLRLAGELCLEPNSVLLVISEIGGSNADWRQAGKDIKAASQAGLPCVEVCILRDTAPGTTGLDEGVVGLRVSPSNMLLPEDMLALRLRVLESLGHRSAAEVAPRSRL